MMMREQDKYIDRLIILPAVLRSYIPPQLLRNVETNIHRVNEHDFIQLILKNSNNQLRMYGTAKELLEDLSLYSHFPLSRKVFPNINRYTIPDLYHNLRGELLYCKQDYLYHLQSSVARDMRRNIPPELVEYMKKHTERLDGCYEFVKYDDEIFEKIRESFTYSQPLKVERLPAGATVTASVGHFVGVPYVEVDYMKAFGDLTSEYPWIFLPNSETKHERATYAVRVFDDGSSKFVMESELYNAINWKNPNREPLKCQDKDGYLRTVEMRDVYNEYMDDITGMDLIHWPITLTRHAAVPIATPFGDHCILAADALTEILSRSIHALQIFQKIKRNMLPKFIKLLEKYFPPDIDCRCFMSLTTIERLREEHDEFWKRYDEKPAKQVRDVGPNGFTAEDLKKELKYLGYIDLFTEITTTTVKFFYMSVFSRRKSSDLTTTDMIREIVNILIEVLFARSPSLQEFAFRQKYCFHCRSNPCRFCTEKFTEADKRIEEEKKIKTVPEAKPKLQSDSSSGQEKTEPVPDEPEIRSEPILPAMDPPSDPSCKEAELGMNYQETIKELEEKLKIAEKEKVEGAEEAENARSDLLEFKECVSRLEAQVEVLMLRHAPLLEGKDKEIEQLKRDHSKLMEKKTGEMEQLKQAHSKMIVEKTKEWTVEKKNHSKTIDELKKSHSDAIKSKTSEFHDELKAKINEKDAEVLQTKRINKELTESIRVLQKKVSDLEDKSDADHLEMAMKQSHLENELADKDRLILGLQESRTQKAAEQDKAKEELHAKISLALSQHKEHFANILNELVPSTPQDNALLLRLQKIRDNFEENCPLKLAKEMVERLISLSSRPEIHQMAQYEYEQYEGKVAVYMQELEVSIDKSSMAIPLLPSQFPSFSDRFIDEYWMEIQKSRTEQVVDNECLYCLVEMTPEQKTLECEHCKKVFHLECSSKWLKVHRSCPHCRGDQLDPNEFPALQ